MGFSQHGIVSQTYTHTHKTQTHTHIRHRHVHSIWLLVKCSTDSSKGSSLRPQV